ncbi:TPA: hypothetical protein DDW69_02300 [candidate division CPR2 bacterium]|uniref:Cell division protein FtsL n=1 Tax=candidate division CPR2 bacterium GW2011_GWC1_41_48 TaxID=1618344 RepID=A0A0G0WCR7_UNCC2|nr:MAG: hypothetical protein UT47_C0001G0262 [candidate division CPR2 bacterium GW2011_GWC2_39_35]KKR29143.1 MAG: hypothetical protein UT60_C0006G0006 [candidate division CPR2 bacterium GW2011_GWD2_39_7]KKS09857.1 MAG: hypothetical protein UU65_C0001G0262 [candidate division CPR2 bacterium GW2011_GWC1_41_48]OGB60081.1 MAG: hypothetical protein A2Y27_02100 [candidate division CPR2 bacterium GWD1_39_7]OGB70634.1 MAG: hypothetical protein A2Y26_01395 [candidate division CPR2 bacterium GWD2_39_7]H
MNSKRNPKINKQYQKSMILGPVSMSFMVITIVVVLILLYLAQSSRLAVRGYDLAALEKKKAEIELESEKLELEVARLQSITEIQRSTTASSLETVKKINYVPWTSTVAVK